VPEHLSRGDNRYFEKKIPVHPSERCDMSLKSKTLLILLVFMALYMAIHGAITRLIILPGFFNLEKTEAEKNIWRPTRALNRELYHLTLLVQDWSVWDDTYNFMVTGSKEYIESNLGVESFSMDRLNLFCLCDTQGNIFWQKMFDLDTKKAIVIPGLPLKAYPPGHPLITFGTEDGSSHDDHVSGIIDRKSVV
jgi:sensor domain CHASE-containing protein